MENKQFYVYILANKRNGTLYTGITSDITKRIYEHKNKTKQGFTSRYKVHLLVYYEVHQDPEIAINREKSLKKWQRKWKLELIEQFNPNWDDLYNRLF